MSNKKETETLQTTKAALWKTISELTGVLLLRHGTGQLGLYPEEVVSGRAVVDTALARVMPEDSKDVQDITKELRKTLALWEETPPEGVTKRAYDAERETIAEAQRRT